MKISNINFGMRGVETQEPKDSLMKPLKSRGKLVDNSIFAAPFIMVNDFADDIVSIKKGIQGKSDDHRLGRTNDLAMKIGALSLAGYLYTKQTTKIRKSMEFVGATMFFSSMVIWPKVFIQKPIEFLYGLNFQQQYIDSQGRKKYFYQDPNYQPWSLWSSKQKNKLGDRMGIPKNIENRDEVIEKKARKIALQANTLWMLTAGFATPLMSALSCAGLEKLVTKYQEKKTLKKTQADFDNIAKASAQYVDYSKQKELDIFLKEHKGKYMDENKIRKLLDIFSADTEIRLRKNVLIELNNIMPQKPRLMDEKAIDDFVNIIYQEDTPNFLKKFHVGPEFFKEMFNADVKPANITTDMNGRNMLIDYLTDNFTNYFNHENGGLKEYNRIFDLELTPSLLNVEGVDFIEKLPKDEAEWLEDKIFTEVRELIDSTIEKFNRPILEDSYLPKVNKLFALTEDLTSQKSVLSAFIRARAGDVQGSFIANSWQKTIDTYMEVLGIKFDDLEQMKRNNDYAGEILDSKISALVKDNSKYKKALSRLASDINEFDTMLSSDMEKKVYNRVDDVLFEFAKKYREAGFKKIATFLSGPDNMEAGSMRSQIKTDFANRIQGARACFYRILETLDLYKRVESGTFEKQLQRISPYDSIPERAEAVTKICKEIMIKATAADYTTKFNLNDNGDFYRIVANLLFADNVTTMDNATSSALENYQTVMKNFRLNRENIVNKMGNFNNELQVYHTVNGCYFDGSPLLRQLSIGNTLDVLTRVASEPRYNTKKWLRMFGGFSIGLVGVTLIAPLFFGRLKKEEVYGIKSKPAVKNG